MTLINQDYYISLSSDKKLAERKALADWKDKVKEKRLTPEQLGIPGLTTDKTKARSAAIAVQAQIEKPSN